MKVMVTGSAGFIGMHLCPELVAAGHEVVGVDQHFNPADPTEYTQQVTYDLRSPNVLRRHLDKHSPDVVVHLAAQVGRVFGEDDIQHTISSNALMTARVAKACAERGIRLTYASTSEVYGDQRNHLCEEGDECVLPHNLYGLSKRWGEEVAALYAPEGLQVVRLSMPYGPGLPAGRGRAALVNFLYNALHRQPLTVHRGAARCWCWVGDTVRGIRLVLETGEQAGDANAYESGLGVYNVGRDDNELSMIRVAGMACEVADAPLDLIVEVDPPAAQTVVKRLSTEKLGTLGWAPTVELREGMELTFEQVKRMAPPVAEGSKV